MRERQKCSGGETPKDSKDNKDFKVNEERKRFEGWGQSYFTTCLVKSNMVLDFLLIEIKSLKEIDHDS